MYNRFVRVAALALAIVLTMSVSVFAGADISSNYASSAAVYAASKDAIATSANKDATIKSYLDRASTYLAADRSALIKDGFLLPAEVPAALSANRKAVVDLLAADGIAYEDLIKTLIVRVPANYALDYGTLSVDRATLAAIRAEGFTDLVFENDLFSVRLSMIDYLATVPETVTNLKFFVGETRVDVPQKVLEKAGGMPILAFREYRDGVAVNNTYSKNAVAIIVKSSMYNVSGHSPTENMFFKYHLGIDKIDFVSNYIYATESDTASFGVDNCTYFLFLPKEAEELGYGVIGGNPGGNSGGTHSGSSGSVTTKSGYTDVADEHWASESIRKLSMLGVISGVGNNMFEPESFVTREQFAKLLAAGFSMPEANEAPFTDVPATDWAFPFVARVYAMGVTRGIGNNLFGYGQQITRQDMAVMIYKVLAAKGGLEGIEADGFTFTDDASIADYARDAVYAMRAKGIINGNPDGTFCPNDSATRAQAAKMLCAAMGI